MTQKIKVFTPMKVRSQTQGKNWVSEIVNEKIGNFGQFRKLQVMFSISLLGLKFFVRILQIIAFKVT